MSSSFIKTLFRRSDGKLNPVGFIAVLMLLPILFAFGAVAFMTVETVRNGPGAARIRDELEGEFKAITAPSPAKSTYYNASHKSSNVLVSSHYQSTLAYSEIRSHYDLQLAKHGWTLYKEESLQDWGRDFGGKSTHYCKGAYRASLQYAGPAAGYGWDFAFAVSWGLDAIFERYPDSFHEARCR